MRHRQTRRATCAILDAIKDGMLEPIAVVRACMAYMSEADVADMASREGLIEDEDENEDEDEGEEL